MSHTSRARRLARVADRLRLLPWPDLAALRLAMDDERPAPDPTADPLGWVRHQIVVERAVLHRATRHAERPDYVFDVRFENHLTGISARILDLCELADRMERRQGKDGPAGLDLMLANLAPRRDAVPRPTV